MHKCVMIDPKVFAVTANKRKNDEGMWTEDAVGGQVSHPPPSFTLSVVIKCLISSHIFINYEANFKQTFEISQKRNVN